MYQEAIENDSSVSFLYLKLLAIGPGQVGKSTFLERLKGHIEWDTDHALPETLPQGSTGQIEMEQMYLQYNREAIAVSFSKEWHAAENTEKEVKMQIIALTSLLMAQTENASSPISTQPQLVSETNGLLVRSENLVVETTVEMDSNTPSDTVTTPTSLDEEHNIIETSTTQNITSAEMLDRKHIVDSPEISNVLQEYEKLRIKCKLDSQEKELLVTDAIINIADVGGQPAFLEMLPSLTIGPAMYLVFMKLLQGLKTPYPVKYRTKGNLQAAICKDYTYTTEEVIFTALSSITCFGHSDEEVEKYVHDNETKTHSLALLMGTFADELTDDNLFQVNENERLLRQQLKETHFFKDGLVNFSEEPNRESILHRVNNKSGGKQEIIKYRRLLEHIMLNKFRKYAIPVKWLELSICLQLLAQQKDVSVLLLSNCIEIGKYLNMSEEIVKAALQFLHKYIGLIMYFPGNEKLKNIVICDPQVLFSSLSKLIFEVYDSKKSLISQSKCEIFIETGHFSLDDIKPFEGSKVLSVEVLVDLLVHLNIAVPSKSMYFLPAVLRSLNIEALISQPGNSKLEPLCVSFQTGFLPLGFVCALIAKLTSEGTLELLGPEQEYEIYKNKVIFRLRGRYDVTLVSWPKYCEFRISRATGASTDEEYHNKNCCPLIRDTVCLAIDQVIQSMTQNSVFHMSQTHKLGFKCPNHKSLNQSYGHEPLAVFDLNNIEGMKCIKCKICPALKHRTINAWLAPRITSQPPSSIETTTGEKLTISITATGANPLHCQWFKDGNKLCDSEYYQGSKTFSLQIHIISNEQGGIYFCEVSNGFGEGDCSSDVSVLILIGEKDSIV